MSIIDEQVFSYASLLHEGLTGERKEDIFSADNDVVGENLTKEQTQNIFAAFNKYADKPEKFLSIAKKSRNRRIMAKRKYTKRKKLSQAKKDDIMARYDENLLRRAKAIGMSDEMMATYPDEQSLKDACDRISPQTNPDASPKEGVLPPSKVYEKNMPDKFEIDSKLECNFIMQNRAQFDEANLQTELRRINRKYGPQKPVKIVKIVTFEPVKGINKDGLSAKLLVTHFTIFMK